MSDMKTAEEKFDEFLSKNGGNSLGSPINAAYEGFLAGYKEATEIAFKEGQSNPKIKQLEWKNVYSIHYVKDDNPIGYQARISEWHINTTKYVLSFAHSGEINAKIYDTLEEAKVAAQEDFERRIKECLITE